MARSLDDRFAFGDQDLSLTEVPMICSAE